MIVKIITTFTFITALSLSTFLQAKEVTFITTLDDYEGKNAYLAMYITSAEGEYQQTLWVSGEKKKYYSSLRGWARASGLKNSEYDGRTGATIPSGKSYTITTDVDDALIDTGYQIRIDSSIEGQMSGRDDIIVNLTRQGVGESTPGNYYIESFIYKF